jgi:Golgi phosphoprotein 3
MKTDRLSETIVMNLTPSDASLPTRPALRVTLPEQILLLMLQESSGRIYPSSKQYLDYAIVGAIILELVAKGWVRIQQGMIKRLSQEPTNDILQDVILKELPQQGEIEPFIDVLQRLSIQTHTFIPVIFDHMRNKGIIEMGGDRYVWHLSKKALMENPGLNMRSHVHHLLFSGIPPMEHEIAFLWVANVCNLLAHRFDPESFKAIEARIRQLVRFEIINHVVSNALDEFQKAVHKLLNPNSL